MIQQRLLYILFFCLTSVVFYGQEICDNGIDDDADGLVDLADPDCACNGIDIIVPSSLFPNPSFEINTCSPGFGRANCAVGWVNPSEGTPDYYDRCNSSISSILPVARCPVPDGEKFFGIADILGNSSTHKEFVGTELLQPMQIGEIYILSFWVGFVTEPDPDWSSPPVNFVIYGNTDPASIAVPYRGKDCPTLATLDTFGTPINPWSVIDMTFISDADNDGWQQVRIEFTATENYAAILLGPSCNVSSGLNYYFLDNLVLSTRSSFSNDFISVRSGLACNNDLMLEVPDMADLTYQWFKDDVAIVGSTNPILAVQPLPLGNGTYICVISNSFGCTMSESFVINENPRQLSFDAATGICPDNQEVIGLFGNYLSYSWGNGLGQNPTVTATDPGTFFVTVVDNDGCIIEGTYDLPRYPDVQFTPIITLESAPAAMDGTIRIDHESGVSNPGVTWWDGTTNNPHINLEEGNYCVTVTADERCPVEDCFDLDVEIQPIIIDQEIEAVRCFNETNGAIHLTITGGLAPFILNWQGHPEWSDRTELENLAAGFYFLELIDGEGTIIERQFEVMQPELLEAELEITQPTCNGATNGSIRISSINGGNDNYQYFWNESTSPGADHVEDLRAGPYVLRIEDDKGCELRFNPSLIAPEAISATIDVLHPFCIGADDGSIHVSNIVGGTAPYEIQLNNQVEDEDIFDLPGDQDYEILILDANQCSWLQSVYLANQTEFNVDIGLDMSIEEYTDALIRATANRQVAQYTWETSDGYFNSCNNCNFLNLHIEQSILVVLDATSRDGCTASDSLDINMTPSKKIYIPNAFSPNNDGINDVFNIYNAGEVDVIGYFRVFNRVGMKIFDIENVSHEDGISYWKESTNKHNLNPGAYVYILEIIFKDGSVKQYSGDISVIR